MGPCPVSFFLNSRGLRQGDPLLSYLSVLAMEVLSSLLERTKEGGYSLGVRVKGMAVRVWRCPTKTLVFL